ncbi:MAG: hypothetical protein Kow0098_28800 [Ignavibacteriaceae bacterium]
MKKTIYYTILAFKYLMLLVLLQGIYFVFGKTDVIAAGFILVLSLLSFVVAGLIQSLINNAGS